MSHNASSLEMRMALQEITGMPTGIVDVSRSERDHNNMHTWRVTFITLRGDALDINTDLTNIAGSRGVSNLVTVPRMIFSEEVPGTYLSGTFDLSLASHQKTLSFDASETDMRTSLDGLLTSAGYSTSSNVRRVGPNQDGAYQWHLSMAGAGDSPLFSASSDNLACGPSCTPIASVVAISHGEISWKQELKLEASHALQTQHITISSAAQIHEVQTIQIFATKGYFHLSLGSYVVDHPIYVLPIATLPERVETFQWLLRFLMCFCCILQCLLCFGQILLDLFNCLLC